MLDVPSDSHHHAPVPPGGGDMFQFLFHMKEVIAQCGIGSLSGGISPLITHNGASGLDTRSPANIEKAHITSKKGPRTVSEEERLRELECLTSLYLDQRGAPTLPEAAIRSNIEAASRKLRHGPKVREGLIVEKVEQFDFDKTLGTTARELARRCQFTVGVRVGTSRIL